jgi:hypothetical protein
MPYGAIVDERPAFVPTLELLVPSGGSVVAVLAIR